MMIKRNRRLATAERKIAQMLKALEAAQEALFWYRAEEFEASGMGGRKVGEQVAAAIAEGKGR